jgi:hypothetical protein
MVGLSTAERFSQAPRSFNLPVKILEIIPLEMFPDWVLSDTQPRYELVERGQQNLRKERYYIIKGNGPNTYYG